MNLKSVENWAGEHPVTLGVGVFVVGVIVFLMLKGSGGAGAAAQTSGLNAAYLGASAAQASSDASVQIAQINANASVQGAAIAGNTSVTNNQTWANQELLTTQANNQQVLNVGAQNLDAQSNYMTILNAVNQNVLNTGQFDPALAHDLAATGYFQTALQNGHYAAS